MHEGISIFVEDGDWYIHHDADEFREAPAPWSTLKEAIQAVDAEGYNAIDFDGRINATFRSTEQQRGDQNAFGHHHRMLPFCRERLSAAFSAVFSNQSNIKTTPVSAQLRIIRETRRNRSIGGRI